MIGCDGASSTTRRLLNLEFEGFTWPERFIATNVYHDFTKHGWKNVHMICSGPVWGLVAKINTDKGGLWRVTFPEDPDIAHDEVFARIPGHYKRIMPRMSPTRSNHGHPTGCVNGPRPPVTWAGLCLQATPPISATPAAGAG